MCCVRLRAVVLLQLHVGDAVMAVVVSGYTGEWGGVRCSLNSHAGSRSPSKLCLCLIRTAAGGMYVWQLTHLC